MKKLLLTLLITMGLSSETNSNYFVDNFLKYSTFYTSVSLNAPFEVKSQWEVDVEKNLSDVATIGNVSGWEYLVKYSTIRSFGEEFVDTES